MAHAEFYIWRGTPDGGFPRPSVLYCIMKTVLTRECMHELLWIFCTNKYRAIKNIQTKCENLQTTLNLHLSHSFYSLAQRIVVKIGAPPHAVPTRGKFIAGQSVTILANPGWCRHRSLRGLSIFYSHFCSVVPSKSLLHRQASIVVSDMPKLTAVIYFSFYTEPMQKLCF